MWGPEQCSREANQWRLVIGMIDGTRTVSRRAESPRLECSIGFGSARKANRACQLSDRLRARSNILEHQSGGVNTRLIEPRARRRQAGAGAGEPGAGGQRVRLHYRQNEWFARAERSGEH